MTSRIRCNMLGPELLAAVLVVAGGALVACQEDIVAPGVCPEFCPASAIEVLDTVLLQSVTRDSAFSGYVEAFEARAMQIASAGSPVPSRGLVLFSAFPENIGTDDLVAPADSFEIQLIMIRRNEVVMGLEVVLHRIPVDLDTDSPYQELDPFFADSTEIGVIAVPDGTGFDTLTVMVPAAAFPNYVDDERATAVGVAVRGPGGGAGAATFASFGTREGSRPPLIQRFARIDSSGVEVTRSDTEVAVFDTFSRPQLPAPGNDTLMVGGEPTSRSLLRLDVPLGVLDSTAIVEAILYIVPVAPAIGAPADTFRVQGNALGADFGPKSPLLVEPPSEEDSLAVPGATVVVGSTDTVAIDITNIVAAWQADSTLPRSLMLRAVSLRNPRANDATQGEAATLAALRFGSSRTPNAHPYVRVTYVPPFGFKVR